MAAPATAKRKIFYPDNPGTQALRAVEYDQLRTETIQRHSEQQEREYRIRRNRVSIFILVAIIAGLILSLELLA